jgi:hypothetical protein
MHRPMSALPPIATAKGDMYPETVMSAFSPKSGHCSPGLTNQEKRIAKSKRLKWARENSHDLEISITYTVKLF